MTQVLRRAVRALFSPVMAAGRAYNETAKRAPLATGVVTTVLKTGAADYFAQKVIEKREQVDWRRNALFSFFGFAYLGCFQYWLYSDLFVRITPSLLRAVGQRGLGPALTFLDQCVHHPLVYFPSFYALKGFVEGRDFMSSMRVYGDDCWENCKALWTVWVPAQLVNFSVVPMHLRIPFVAAVSFGWTVIISVMRGNLSETFEDPAEVPIMLQHHHHQEQEQEQQAEQLAQEQEQDAAAAAGASLATVDSPAFIPTTATAATASSMLMEAAGTGHALLMTSFTAAASSLPSDTAAAASSPMEGAADSAAGTAAAAGAA